jgi:phosphoribosylcarboxyaminoimidazole (NCAIR) mutase
VAIDSAANAALLAVAILAVGDDDLTARLAEYRRDLAESTLAG